MKKIFIQEEEEEQNTDTGFDDWLAHHQKAQQMRCAASVAASENFTSENHSLLYVF